MSEGIVVSEVIKGSLAEELGIEQNDKLLQINGNVVRDIIDYSYFCAIEEEFVFEIEKCDGEIWEIEFEKDPQEQIGLIFETPKPHICGNNCIFCFVHQLPKGLRKPLYLKDEDYRLSFLNGNYVTLANISSVDIERIAEQRLSPLYISVHTVDEPLRQKLLGKNDIPPILEQLKQLAAQGIKMHTQIVLLPSINDGEYLDKTISTLVSLYPAILSVAIVPVGITSHRKNLPEIEPLTADYAKRFLKKYFPLSRHISKFVGEPFLFLADEWFVKGDIKIPRIDYYGDFPQIENGVGMLALFKHEAKKLLKKAKYIGEFSVATITGYSAAKYIKDFAAELSAKTSVNIEVVPVKNLLFGESITVTGLISGADIVQAFADKKLEKPLLIPDVMLKDGENIFLDDMTLPELSLRVGVEVISFEPTPQAFYKALHDIAAVEKYKT